MAKIVASRNKPLQISPTMARSLVTTLESFIRVAEVTEDRLMESRLAMASLQSTIVELTALCDRLADALEKKQSRWPFKWRKS